MNPDLAADHDALERQSSLRDVGCVHLRGVSVSQNAQQIRLQPRGESGAAADASRFRDRHPLVAHRRDLAPFVGVAQDARGAAASKLQSMPAGSHYPLSDQGEPRPTLTRGKRLLAAASLCPLAVSQSRPHRRRQRSAARLKPLEQAGL